MKVCVFASPPGHKAALPSSTEAFVSRLMVQVNCTGDFVWGNRWAQMCSKTVYSKPKTRHELFLSPSSFLFFLIVSTGDAEDGRREVKLSQWF